MAIAFDAAAGAQGTAVSSLSWSHACAGANRLLCVGAGHSAGATTTVTSITYNSVATTQKWSINFPGTLRYSLYFQTAPSLGSNTVALTLAANQDEVGAASVSFTGVNQGTPLDTEANANGSGATASVNVTSATNDVVIDAVYYFTTAITAGAGQTSRREEENIGTATSFGMSTEAGGATVTMSWSGAATWAIGGVSINPSATSVRTGDSNAALT